MFCSSLRRCLPVVFALALSALLAVPVAAAQRGGSSADLGGLTCRTLPMAGNGALPIGILESCPGVRPGAGIQIPQPDGGTAGCTLNFLFSDDDGNRYGGTAGHCALGDNSTSALQGEEPEGQEVAFKHNDGPVVNDADGHKIGRFVYAVLDERKDFSLIRLDEGVDSDPQMCHFGGPTGINRDLDSGATTLNFYGQGLLIGTVLPARTFTALRGLADVDFVRAEGPIIPGDSGGPVTSPDGRAVGVMVTLGPIGLGEITPVGITRIGPQLERAEERLGTDLTILTAP